MADPKLDFDEDFRDWAFYQLPIWLIEALWEGYNAPKPTKIDPKLKPISTAEIFALKDSLEDLFRS